MWPINLTEAEMEDYLYDAYVAGRFMGDIGEFEDAGNGFDVVKKRVYKDIKKSLKDKGLAKPVR